MADNNKKYKVIVDGQAFDFTAAELSTADLVQQPGGDYHLIDNHHSLSIRVIQSDGKQLLLEAGGKIHTVEIRDEMDAMLEQMGFNKGASKQVKEIKAPMPGLVLEIVVVEGAELLEGAKLLVLGAMKMENSILLPASARIKKIHVTVGQAVDKGQVMVELE